MFLRSVFSPCFVIHYLNNFLSSFTIILVRKRELVTLLELSSYHRVTVSVLWLFLAVSWVGLQCVIMAFPDHTHILFYLRDHAVVYR